MTDTTTDTASDPAARFDVFISYSHDDEQIAERLSRRIRRYNAPRAIKRPRRPLSVFRDVERLTAHPELGDALDERINQATNLMVLCSPAAVASEYVDQEIKTFIEQKGVTAVTLVLVDGTPADSFPPTINATYEEPLYIDLRLGGGFFQARGRFLEESLRIIAALLGVDYADLSREDERHRSRLRWVSVLTILTTSLGLGGFYIADNVAADTWREIPLPTSYYDSSLLPIKDYAVYIPNPDIRLFLGYGADHAAQYPEFPIALYGGNSGDFVKQTETFLLNEKDFEVLNRPVATLKFQVIADIGALTGSPSENSSVWGSGELRIHAHLNPAIGAVEFGGVLRYEQLQDDPTVSTLLFPPTQMNPQNPLGFRPWPTNVFNRSDLLPSRGYLEGSMSTAWDDDDRAISYEILDVEESFWEGNDGQWIEKGVVTDGDEERQVVIAGNTQDIRSIDEEQWPEILEDPGWASYRAPARSHVEELAIFRNRGDRIVQGGQVDEGLISFIESTSADTSEVFYRVTQITNQTLDSTLQLARIVAELYDDISGQKRVIDSYTLVRNDSEDKWQQSLDLEIDATTNILDTFVINGDTSAFLILTDKEGFFLSRDQGNSWEDFNHGESALLNGSQLRPVVTGTQDGIYVLYIDPASESSNDGSNQLFRYARRSWPQRFRAGLVSLLQASP